MSSEVLVPQVALTDRNRCDSAAVGDDVAISARNVGKMYYLYDRPQDRLKQAFLWGRKQLYREFWALRDVSFEVKKGEAVGIIGRNGSGKSTLLQIVAGTLTPTTGEVWVNGRVTALLELGAGFNPEFTGRENVFMNGAILGISGEEIEERFDDIAAFADIGEFIDQPVKIYSSGMYVRLAFAIATSVDPDILIVDEALAVGDEYFQHRCMARMNDFRESDRTILFVSHDTGAVKQLCDQAIWLEHGGVMANGQPEDVVSRYRAALMGHVVRSVDESEAHGETEPSGVMTTLVGPEVSTERVIPNIDRRFGDGRAEIIGVGVYDEKGRPVSELDAPGTMILRVSACFKEAVLKPIFGFHLRDRLGVDLTASNTAREGFVLPAAKAGDIYTVRFTCQLPLFHQGNYSLAVAVADGELTDNEMCDWIDNAYALRLTTKTLVYHLLQVSVICSLDNICSKRDLASA